MTRVNQYDVRVGKTGSIIHFQVLTPADRKEAIGYANIYLKSLSSDVVIADTMDNKKPVKSLDLQFVAEIGANPVQQPIIDKVGFCIYKIHGCN